MDSKIWKLIDEFSESEIRRGLKPATAGLKKSDLEKFFIYLEEKRPGKTYANITADEIREYLEDYEELTGRPVTSGMHNKRISTFIEFYNYLLENEEAILNPAISIEYLPVSKGDHLGIFTEEEVKRILKVIPDTPIGRRDLAMIELLYSSGLRLSELVNLDIDDIDFDAGEIFIREGKGDKERIVPAGEEALKILERYSSERHRWMKPGRERRAVFLSAQGLRVCGGCVQETVKKWKKKAGVKSRGSTHAFRHSMASHLLSHGAPITAIQRILGHEHITTTQEYVHLLQEDMKNTHAKAHPKAKEEE